MTNKPNYNKIYFMHIPKTGGRYIINNVLDPIKEQLKNNNIEIINIKSFDHSNWYSKIDDDTYIITVLRDPVSQIVSLYSHDLTTDTSGNLKTNTNIDLYKHEFYETIKSNLNYQNFQSKSFMRNEFHTFGLKAPTVIVDEGLMQKKIHRVNLLLNNNNLKNNASKIQEKIFLDLGINGFSVTSKNNGVFYNPYSKYFYDTFSSAEKDSIKVYNRIDDNLYRNSNYYKI
jgi:hypothetical protein